jgi:hypothetical protein
MITERRQNPSLATNSAFASHSLLNFLDTLPRLFVLE